MLISSLSSFSSLLFNFFCVFLISSDTISIVFSQNVKTSDMYQGGLGPWFCCRKPSFKIESVVGPISRMIAWNKDWPWKYELVAKIRISRGITNSHPKKSSEQASEILIWNSNPNQSFESIRNSHSEQSSGKVTWNRHLK